MFGCLPLLPHLCMLMGEKYTLQRFVVFRQRSVTSQPFSRILFQQQGRRTDEIFMLIVAKLPTKEDKRLVMRSCQAALS